MRSQSQSSTSRPPKPRVAIVIPSLRSGGCERQVANLLEDLESRFCFEVLVKEADFAFPIPSSIPIRCSNIDMATDRTTLAKGWRFVRRIVSTGRLLRAGGYDVICTFIDLNNVVTFIASRMFRVTAPIVCVEQTVIPEYFEHDPFAQRYQKVMRCLLSFTYRRVDRLVVLTVAIAEFLREMLGVRRSIVVIEPGVDAAVFRPRGVCETVDARLGDEFATAPIRIVSVGGLIERKDPAFLVRAMPRVVSAQPDAHLFLVGSGPEEPRIRALIDELDLTKSVHLLGWRANVADYVRFADVSVLASVADPLPQVILESLLCGVPVVTTRSTSEWDRVLSEPWLGEVVDVRDEGMFAQAVLNVLEREAHRHRDDIVSYARSRFDRSLMAEAYATVLNECSRGVGRDSARGRN